MNNDIATPRTDAFYKGEPISDDQLFARGLERELYESIMHSRKLHAQLTEQYRKRSLKGRWFKIRTRWGTLSWEIGNPTSGGFKRGPYGSWSYGCKLGAIMWSGSAKRYEGDQS